MATATKIYEIADEVSITSKGVVLTEGTEVTAEDFLSEEVFNTLVKAKKIIEVTKSNGRKNKSNRNEPTSSSGAAEPSTEDTTPHGEAGKGSEDGSDGSAE